MNKPSPTTQAIKLNEALNAVGIETALEYFDGHKHVDIFIPKGKIYIELNGEHHYTNHLQIISDFERDHYSDDDGFHTLRISNEVAERNTIKIARALKKMLNF